MRCPLVVHRRGPIVVPEDNEAAPSSPRARRASEEEAEEAGGAGSGDEGDRRGWKGMKRYSSDDRWLYRCNHKGIGADLADGCGCPKQCTDQLTVAMVEEGRTSEGKKGGVLRRSELRLYLESNRTATKLGFKLHPEHGDAVQLCPGAFGILKGYGHGHTYKFIREVKAGIDQDDTGTGQRGQDGFMDDSLVKMVSHGTAPTLYIQLQWLATGCMSRSLSEIVPAQPLVAGFYWMVKNAS